MTHATALLAFRPPYDWAGMRDFFGIQLLSGVECVDEGHCRRTLRLGEAVGWVSVRHVPAEQGLRVTLSPSLRPMSDVTHRRLRAMFDLDAPVSAIAAHLGRDPLLAGLVQARPGLRVPGTCDGFELAVRTILGQQISVRAATVLAARFVAAFGERIETPWPALTHLSPTPARIAAARWEEIAALGIIGARARAIHALAGEMAAGRLVLEAGLPPEPALAQLLALPGIGPWTAQSIAMRALGWPDAFPKEDVALRARLGGADAAEAERRAEAWRPWRSYALLHLWQEAIASIAARSGS